MTRRQFVRLTLPATLALTVISGVHSAASWAQEGGGGTAQTTAAGGMGGQGGEGGQGGRFDGPVDGGCGTAKSNGKPGVIVHGAGCC